MSRASRVLSLCRNRRPVRRFTDRPVPAEALECMLEAARFAPSAKEAQPWRLLVVLDGRKRSGLATAAFNHPHARSAPAIVVVCARVHSHVSGVGRPSWPVDLAAATQSMVLAASDLGLATSWLTGFREPSVRATLGIPDEVPVGMMLAVGYPDGLEPLPERAAWEEVVAWDGWEAGGET